MKSEKFIVDRGNIKGWGTIMAEESDVVRFLKDHKGQTSLENISKGLGVPKYGSNSAYSLLQSLRSKGVVDRKGELWVFLAPEETVPKETAPPPAPTEEKKPEAAPEVEQIMKAMAKTLAEDMKRTRAPADEWELATKPMKTEIERK